MKKIKSISDIIAIIIVIAIVIIGIVSAVVPKLNLSEIALVRIRLMSTGFIMLFCVVLLVITVYKMTNKPNND